MAAARATSARLSPIGLPTSRAMSSARSSAWDSRRSAALLRTAPRPGGEGCLPPRGRLRRRLDGPLGLGLAGLRGRAEDLGGVRGVRDLVDLAGVGGHPLAPDEVLGIYLGFDHGLPPRYSSRFTLSVL